MRQLFTIDLKDYDEGAEEYRRPSVRGIIINDDGKIAMIFSRKYGYYKFPGGGIESSESQLETLAREIEEEAGLTLIPDSAEEFGEVLRRQDRDGKIFVQQNFYYTCKVKDEIGEQNLDEGEKEQEFELRFVPIEEAIKANEAVKADPGIKAKHPYRESMVERELNVLKLLAED